MANLRDIVKRSNDFWKPREVVMSDGEIEWNALLQSFTYDFCTPREKWMIKNVLVEAMKWAKNLKK